MEGNQLFYMGTLNPRTIYSVILRNRLGSLTIFCCFFCFEFFFYSVFPFIIYPSPFTLPYSLFPVALVKNSRASHLRALVNKVSYWQTSNATTVPVLVSQFQIFLSECLTSSIYSLPCLGENLSETVERQNFIHVAQWKRRQKPQFIPAPSDNWSTAYN